MRSCRLMSVFALVLVATAALGADAIPPRVRGRALSVRQDRILVKPKANADLGALHTSLKCTPVWQSPAMHNLQVVKLPEGANVPDMIVKYMSSGLAEYAEPDYPVYLTADPNDPQYTDGTQWSLHNTGDGGGVAGADIHAREAWDIQSSAASVIVAVVDTGIRYTHEDLADNIWVNPGEIAGDGLDNDGDNIIDDVHGVNTLDDSGDVRDDEGHGTHVAGIIGAVGNNGKGVSGVAWSVKLMACKALDSSGSGSISTVVKAIDYARAHGATVINNSYGINAPLEAPLLALKDAIAATRTAGIIFVVAAGNESIDNDQPANAPSYPASFDFDNIVSVASTSRADGLSYFSNFGQASVDLAAPGEDIVGPSFASDSSYNSVSGTSESTPIVSGAFALMQAHFPTESYLQLYNRVFATTDPLPSLQGRCRTGGRLNLYKALASASSRPVNDDFAAAIVVQGAPFAVSGINVDATKEAGEPNHAGDPGGTSVWWSWTAPASGHVMLTSAGSTFGTLLGVYTGSAPSQLTEVTSGSSGTVLFDAVQGTNYHLAVDSVAGATGSIALSLKYPPSNDDFAKAAPITTFAVQSGSNADATRETAEPLHAATYGGKSVWWSWIPTASTRVVISTEDSTFDTLLAVYTGTALASLVEVASNNDENALLGIMTSRLEFDAVAGVQYWIAVDGADGASGNIRLHILPIAGTVRVFATVPWASEAGPKPGEFTVTRTGSTAAAMVVNYKALSPADVGFWDNAVAQADMDYVSLPGTVTIPAGASSVTIPVTPIDNTLYDETRDVILMLLSSPNYTLATQYYDIVHIQDNETFDVLSTITATPNPAFERTPVTFSFSVNGSFADYSWDFGDGESQSSASGTAIHVFAAPGTYTVTAIATFQPSGFASSSPALTERLAITIGPADAMEVSSLQLTMDFAGGSAMLFGLLSEGNDRLLLKGRLPVGKDFKAAGMGARVDIGGVMMTDAYDTEDTSGDQDAVSISFTLGKAGSARDGRSTFKLSRPDSHGMARFSATIASVSFADALDDEGLINATVNNKRVAIPVTIALGTTTFYAAVPALYSAKEDKKGVAKGPPK